MVAHWEYWKEGRGGGQHQSCRATIMPYYLTLSRFMQRGSLLRAFLGMCALLLLLAACQDQNTTQKPHTTPTPPIGTLPGAATGAQPTGPVPPDTRLQLTIGLATNQQAFAGDLAAIYDPTSQQYRHFLTPYQITER